MKSGDWADGKEIWKDQSAARAHGLLHLYQDRVHSLS